MHKTGVAMADETVASVEKLAATSTDVQVLNSADVELTADAAQLKSETIRYDDMNHVVINQGTINGEEMWAAVIGAREPRTYSNTSGLERYHTLKVVFAPDAAMKAREFEKAAKKHSVSVMKTTLLKETFARVFLNVEPTSLVL